MVVCGDYILWCFAVFFYVLWYFVVYCGVLRCCAVHFILRLVVFVILWRMGVCVVCVCVCVVRVCVCVLCRLRVVGVVCYACVLCVFCVFLRIFLATCGNTHTAENSHKLHQKVSHHMFT